MNIDVSGFQTFLERFPRVIIWGLKKQYHTHRYIHAGFYDTLKKLGAEVVWTDYDPKKAALIKPGDLVISSQVQGKGVGECFLPIVKNAYYCLHNFSSEIRLKIDPKFLVNLQVYTSAAEAEAQKWNEVTFFNPATGTLYQPWGTNLLPWEFKKPTFNKAKIVFWIGSVWNNRLNQGNMSAILELKTALAAHGLSFFALRFVPEWLSVFLTRQSRLAPAIVGQWQEQNNYLPCRMFKNISYGCLGFSNVKKFGDLYNGANIIGGSIAELVNGALSLSRRDYLDMVSRQQEITKQHTYMHKLLNIYRALVQIRQ